METMERERLKQADYRCLLLMDTGPSLLRVSGSLIHQKRCKMTTIVQNQIIDTNGNGIKVIPGSGALVRGQRGVYFVFRNPITKTLQCSCGKYASNCLKRKWKEPCKHIERVLDYYKNKKNQRV